MSEPRSVGRRPKRQSTKSIFNKESKLKRCFRLLEEGGRKIPLKRKDVVVVLGMTGSGKTTLVQFLADKHDTLVAKWDEDSDEYTIIGAKSTPVPECTTDPESGSVYCDCPGFGIREAADDLAATYLTKNVVVENTENVKFLLTMEHGSVKNKGVDPTAFAEFVRYVSRFIRNVEKYGQSIALIVTKVDNNPKRVNNQWVPVPDHQVIANVAQFLKTFQANSEKLLTAQAELAANAKKFVDILLTKNADGEYERIGVFRRPDQSGPLARMELLQPGRAAIKKIVAKGTTYTRANENDFGYAISETSKNGVNEMLDEIKTNVHGYTNETLKDIRKYYESKEANSNDIRQLQNELLSDGEKVRKLSETMSANLEPAAFVKKLLALADELHVNLKKNYLRSGLLEQRRYVEFLETVSQQKLADNANVFWTEGLGRITEYLERSTKWYRFLGDLYDRLTSYDVQKDKSKFEYLRARRITDVRDKNLRRFVEDHWEWAKVEQITDVKTDSTRLNFLNRVFEKTLANGVFEYENVTGTYEGRGDCLKLSEVDQELLKNATILNLFATSKIFVDVDLHNTDKGLRQVTMIAPVYEVVGQRKIVLNGKDGRGRRPERAHGGSSPGQRGGDGAPGVAGKSAGHFFGVVERIVNEENLSVHARGGNGGKGQDGGDGVAGKNVYVTAEYANINKYRQNGYDVVLNESQYRAFDTDLYCVQSKEGSEGKNGGNGGDGGHGGAGGKGGNAGNVTLVFVDDQQTMRTPTITIRSATGDGGPPGRGGLGGPGGNPEETLAVTVYTRTPYKDMIAEKLPNSAKCPNANFFRAGQAGVDGMPGANAVGLENAEIVPSESESSVTRYVNFLRASLTNERASREKLAEFLRKLNENPFIRNLSGIAGLTAEFTFLEELYIRSNGYFHFWPTYRDLLRRVRAHAARPTHEGNSPGHQQLLDALRVAVLSKICLLKQKPRFALITDTRIYLNSVANDVKNNEITKGEYVRNYSTEIHNSLQQILAVIRKHSVDELDDVSKTIQKNVRLLIRQITVTEKTAITQPNPSFKELEYHLYAMKTISVLRKAARLLNFVVRRANDRLAPKKLTQSANYLERCEGDTKNVTKREALPSKGMADTFNNRTSENGPRNINGTSKINAENQNDAKTRRIIDVCGGAVVDKDCVNITSNEELEVLNRAVSTSEAFLAEVQFYSENLDDLIARTDKVLANTTDTTDDDVIRFSYIHDEVKGNVDEAKSLMRKTQQNFELPTSLAACFNELERQSTAVVNLYEHLEYREYLSATVTNIERANPIRENEITAQKEVKKALSFLNAVVESNLLVALYRGAITTLDQLIFPFADSFASLAALNVTVGDVLDKKAKGTILEKLENLNAALETDRTYDEHVYNGDFVHIDDSALGPFYVWRNESHGTTIADLLSGKEIILKANATEGVAKHAVKFNTIGLKFKSVDASVQKPLEDDLKTFRVTMTHLEDSVYRCGHEFYQSTFEKKSITFSYARDGRGEPAYANNVYKKLKEGDFVLSPYTYWSVQLKGSNFDGLKKYANHVDLILEGHGQFIENPKICNGTVLKNYYKLVDSATNDIFLEGNQSDWRDAGAELPNRSNSSDNRAPGDCIKLQNSTNSSNSTKLDTNISAKKSNQSGSSNATISKRTRRSANPETIDVDYLNHGLIEKRDTSRSSQSNGVMNWLLKSASKILPIGYFNNQKTAVPVSYNEQPKNSAITSSSAHYNINDTLILTDLLIRSVTKSKPKYFQECSTNFENARACALDIITEFEEILQSLSQYDGEYDFDPAKLMAKIENEIINGNQNNVGKILLNAVETESQLDEAEFNRRFKMMTRK